ncbi:MAG TPA: hypothetical protein VJA94_01320 [Candidatus Angelobacter sp.]
MNDIQHNDSAVFRRYLLGQSNAGERSTVERRLMTDREYLDALTRAEEEMIDEYARGNLDAHEKELFESLFLNVPERREKIAFARAFNRFIARHAVASSAKEPAPLPQPVWQRIATVVALACAILLALVSGFIYRRFAQARTELAAAEVQRSASETREKAAAEQLKELEKRNQELENEIAALRQTSPSATSELFTLALTSGWTRSSESVPAANLSPAIKNLRLELAVPDESHYGRYRAQLQTVEGKILWNREPLQSQHASGREVVTITMAASGLPQSDYLVTLNGLTTGGPSEKVASYYFRVVKK